MFQLSGLLYGTGRQGCSETVSSAAAGGESTGPAAQTAARPEESGVRTAASGAAQRTIGPGRILTILGTLELASGLFALCGGGGVVLLGGLTAAVGWYRKSHFSAVVGAATRVARLPGLPGRIAHATAAELPAGMGRCYCGLAAVQSLLSAQFTSGHLGAGRAAGPRSAADFFLICFLSGRHRNRSVLMRWWPPAPWSRAMCSPATSWQAFRPGRLAKWKTLCAAGRKKPTNFPGHTSSRRGQAASIRIWDRNWSGCGSSIFMVAILLDWPSTHHLR